MQNNDLISRDAAKKIVSLMVCAPTIKIVAEHEIDDLPAVDAAPVVHGRWIRIDKEKCKCSVCDVIHYIAQYPHGAIDWCPNCGAKMETEISNITKKKFAPSLDDVIKEFNAKWTISGAKMDGGDDDV